MSQAEFGACHLKWAPIESEPAGALPTYGDVINLAELVQCNHTPNYASGSIHGNNKVVISKDKLIGGSLAVQTVGMTPEEVRSLYGAEGEARQVIYGESDEPPMGGATWIKNLQTSDKGEVWEAHILYKVKAARAAENASTANNSLTFQAKSTNFTAYITSNGAYEKYEEFDTEAEALAWCDEQLGVTAGGG